MAKIHSKTQYQLQCEMFKADASKKCIRMKEENQSFPPKWKKRKKKSKKSKH